jgi:hypothetical protein
MAKSITFWKETQAAALATFIAALEKQNIAYYMDDIGHKVIVHITGH